MSDMVGSPKDMFSRITALISAVDFKATNRIKLAVFVFVELQLFFDELNSSYTTNLLYGTLKDERADILGQIETSEFIHVPPIY